MQSERRGSAHSRLLIIGSETLEASTSIKHHTSYSNTLSQMGRLPPHEYTDEPRGGFEQIMDKLPQTSQQPDTNDVSWTAVTSSKEDPDSMTAARNSKSYFVFASFMTLLGLSFSIVSMMSCSFGVVNWAVDGSTTATQYSITHLGLFRWYNPRTSSCMAYTQDMTDFLYVNGAARGLSVAALVLGGCAALIIFVVAMANLGGCVKKQSRSRFNLNSTSLSTTFFVLSALTFISSILQLCTLTYFNHGNLPDSVTTCNANQDSNCTMGMGAHYGVAAFFVYRLGALFLPWLGLGVDGQKWRHLMVGIWIQIWIQIWRRVCLVRFRIGFHAFCIPWFHKEMSGVN